MIPLSAPRDVGVLKQSLERLHAQRKREAIESFEDLIDCEFAEVPRQSWEAMLGISPGYLSRWLNTSGRVAVATGCNAG